MKSTIRKSELSALKSFDNLFIEMTARNCNQKCNHCYIDFPKYKKVEDFIKPEIITETLNDLRDKDIKCIYLTGAEPMTHPDFNTILRNCLNKTTVCICTNGSFINEKKARFLKKVDNEFGNEIIFAISLDHYNEVKNDEIRYRGAYRQAIFAVKHLIKYNFSPIVHIVNYYDEDTNNIYNEFYNIFSNIGYEIDKKHIKITPYHNKNVKFEEKEIKLSKYARLDCQYGRILTSKGIYSCPFLANDYRGRSGSNFKNYSDKTPLESDFCLTCTKSGQEIFGINVNNFE